LPLNQPQQVQIVVERNHKNGSWFVKSHLDAGDSSDEDGEIVAYKWEQTDGPEVDPKDSGKQVAIFDIPESAADSNLVFKLTVTDDRDDSGADDVTVEVEQISQDESSSQGECN
jgi:hypothetical protein